MWTIFRFRLCSQEFLRSKESMSKSTVLKKTILFVKKRLSKEGTGHDWWHIERVYNNARAINKKEKADHFIVGLTVLLHDVGDRKVLGTVEDDYSIAENFLRKVKVSENDIKEVLFIIRNMSFSHSLNKKQANISKEFQVVQDADRLDALGAIGIARTFAYGGSKQRPLYDPTKRPQNINTTANYRKLNSSSFHHFYEKILVLKNLMNTETGKTIAIERHKYLQEYMKQFLLEWDGER